MLQVDCAVTPAVNPSTLVIVKGVPSASVTPTSYNAIIDTEIADSFITGKPVYAIDPTAYDSWTTATHLNSDGLHPNDRGHNAYVLALIDTIGGLGYRYGLNSMAYGDIVAAPTPRTLSDNFTRADSATLGVTSTGSVAWENDDPFAEWSIVSNKAAPRTTSAWALATVETGKADCTVSWTIGTATNLGLAFRCATSSTASTHIILFGGTLYSGTNTGGAYTPISAATGATPTFTAGDVIDAVLSGSSITLKKNGTQVATYTSSFNQTATKHGFISNSSTVPRVSAFSVA